MSKKKDKKWIYIDKGPIDEWLNQRWEFVYLDGNKSKYRISEHGILWSDYIGRPMKPSPNSDGYMTTILTMNGKNYTIAIHRLVAITFIPNPLNLPEVNHKDGDKSNNDVSNLEWVSHKENMIHANDNGLRSKIHGNDNPNNKYSSELIHEACRLLENWMSPIEVSRKLGISHTVVKSIAMQRIWDSITCQYNLPMYIHPNIVNIEDGKILSDIELLQEIGLPGTISEGNVQVVLDLKSNRKYKVQRSSLG